MNKDSITTSTRSLDEVKEIPQIQVLEFRRSLANRLNELGYVETKGAVPSNKIFKLIQAETDLDWRSLKDYWSGDSNLNSIGYAKLFTAFRFVKLAKVDNSLTLVQTLINRDCKTIILDYGYPRNDKLANHATAIEHGLKAIKKLWNKTRGLPSDQLERLKKLVDFETEVEEEFDKFADQGVFLYLAKIPSFIQPPEEQELEHLVSAYMMCVTTIEVEDVTLEVNWDNKI